MSGEETPDGDHRLPHQRHDQVQVRGNPVQDVTLSTDTRMQSWQRIRLVRLLWSWLMKWKVGRMSLAPLVKLFDKRGSGRQTATRGSLAKFIVGPGCDAQHTFLALFFATQALVTI